MRQFNVVVLGGKSLFQTGCLGILITLLAAGGVGKSALTVRWVRDVFLETYDPTIEGTLLSCKDFLEYLSKT